MTLLDEVRSIGELDEMVPTGCAEVRRVQPTAWRLYASKPGAG
jgi:hypothetical protein